ncbi:N(G),N(G)-dimethylarginine dimethylaminohydrolase 1 [Anticarsia gemmatalis]|uniref:N(G),N(G)-dimethylarginine dimethylaminohydrolase 1 n=1 Tax=Anticarsia gemmatalis TaxID=129554 RepID=UPI003F770219
MEGNLHNYSLAIVGLLDPNPGQTPEYDKGHIDIEALRHERDGFLRVLRELPLQVVELSTKGNLRDKLLMEELAIICRGIALLPRQSGSASVYNKNLLQKFLKECGLAVTVQDPHDNTAKIHCPDVLFTGREFFVGISPNTNEAGASYIAETFPEFPCTPIKMPKDAMPLKRYITVAGNDVLSVCDSPEGIGIRKKIEREANYNYQTLTVPTLDGANCVFVNGTLFHKGIEDIGNECFKVFCDRIDFPRRSLKFTELMKLDLELSSCVLFLNPH